MFWVLNLQRFFGNAVEFFDWATTSSGLRALAKTIACAAFAQSLCAACMCGCSGCLVVSNSLFPPCLVLSHWAFITKPSDRSHQNDHSLQMKARGLTFANSMMSLSSSKASKLFSSSTQRKCSCFVDLAEKTLWLVIWWDLMGISQKLPVSSRWSRQPAQPEEDFWPSLTLVCHIQ